SEPLAHLGPAAQLLDELGIQPRLVDAQAGVAQQTVAVEPLDVVALEGRPVTPDVDPVSVHRLDEHCAGDRPPEGRGVEVRTSATADVEGAAGQGGKPLLDQSPLAVDLAGQLRAILQSPPRDGVDVRLVVLAEVGGVAAGHGAFVAHPGDRHRGVKAAGEGDTDALAHGETGHYFAHVTRVYTLQCITMQSIGRRPPRLRVVLSAPGRARCRRAARHTARGAPAVR